jgi:hypothetical protein
MMHGHEKSDSAIVAVKPANKVARAASERSVAVQEQSTAPFANRSAPPNTTR